MKHISNIWFGLRWGFHILSLIFHWVYLLLIFLSKPGATLLIAYVLHMLVLGLHIHTYGLIDYHWDDGIRVWINQTINWFSYDREARGLWFWLEIPALIIALSMLLLPQGLLRATLGLFPAKTRPLPPQRAVRAPDQRIRVQKARVALDQKPSFDLKTRQSSLSEIPPEVRELLSVT